MRFVAGDIIKSNWIIEAEVCKTNQVYKKTVRNLGWVMFTNIWDVGWDEVCVLLENLMFFFSSFLLLLYGFQRFKG